MKPLTGDSMRPVGVSSRFVAPRTDDPPAAPFEGSRDFRAVYREHFPFVWRTVARLGVWDGAVDDVVQEVFLVAYRKLPLFEGRSSMRTWLFGIVRRVVSDHRRSSQRRRADGDDALSTMQDVSTLRPDEALAEQQAFRLLNAVLDELDEDKREALVLAEFEQLTMLEIAELLEVNANTISSRLRAARREFEAALARRTTRAEWSSA